MSSRFVVPFDNNPASTSFKTASYTIPSGKYARVRLASITGVNTATRSTAGTTVMTCNTATINGTNVKNGPIFSAIDINRSSVGSTTGNMTLPAGDWSVKINAIILISSGSTTASTSFDSIDVIGVNSGTSADNIYHLSQVITLGAKTIGTSVTNISGSGGARTIISAEDVRENPKDIWLKAGDIISGTGTFSWFVEEYNAIS
jgi:hypothetical protein